MLVGLFNSTVRVPGAVGNLFGLFKYSVKKLGMEKAQPIKCWLGKNKNLSFIPRTLFKKKAGVTEHQQLLEDGEGWS